LAFFQESHQPSQSITHLGLWTSHFHQLTATQDPFVVVHEEMQQPYACAVPATACPDLPAPIFHVQPSLICQQDDPLQYKQ
jgi:hypothetical protein